MGVCMSRCGGDAQAAGPAPTSRRSYSFDNTESLKQFLHLQSALRSENPSPRTSLGGVPHSSELFSLPPSDPEYRSSSALSPSPRTSERAWRFSADRTGKRVRPAAPEAAAHQQRLVNAIARLERLRDGKQSGLHTSSASEKEEQNTSRSRNVCHYQLPLLKQESVLPVATNFLLEVGSCVSRIEAPEAARSVAKAVSRLVSGGRVCDETDSDDMFTVFGASDGSSGDGEARRQRSATSLHQLVQSASQGSAQNPSPERPARQSSSQISSSLRRSPKSIDIEDPSTKSMGEGSDEEAAAMDMTVTMAILKKSSSPVMRRAPSPSRMRALKRSRRRLSRSLDSRESGADFADLLRSTTGPTFAARRLSNCTTTTSSQAAFIDSKSTQENIVVLPATGSFPGLKLSKQAVCDEKVEESCTVQVLDASTLMMLDTSTVELATSEVQQSPNVVIMLVEDQSPTTSAESCLTDEDRSPSTSLASAQSSFRDSPFAVNARSCEESYSSERSSESVSPSLRSSECPSETDDFHPVTHSEFEYFQMFLSKAFNSLVKLLVAEREQTERRCDSG